MEDTRAKKRRITYAGLALVVALAFAVSLKERLSGSDDSRYSLVISEFINLSAAPDPRGLDFLSKDRVQRGIRADRLAHIAPDVLSAYATALEVEEPTLRAQIADPNQSNAFDYTGLVFNGPEELEQGQAGPWSWAIVVERAEIQTGETVELVECGQHKPCRNWLLYWNNETWYYAPIGSEPFNAALTAIHPEFAGATALLEQ